jgi:polysaccharide biosynthesis protein PslH
MLGSKNSLLMNKPAAHILVVTPAYPYPPIDGHTLRNYNFLRNLSSRFSFDLLTFSHRGEKEQDAQLIQQLGSRCRHVTLVDGNSLQSLRLSPIEKVHNIFFPHLFSCGEGVSAEMSSAIAERIASEEYDLLYCCGLSMSAHAHPYLGEIPSIVDAVDSLSLLQRSFMIRAKGFWKKAVESVNLFWANRYENVHLGKVRDLVFISSVDRASALQNCPHSTVWVAPNGVDTEYFKPQGQRERLAHQLLFTGVMDYSPNHEAMMYFIEQILPLVQRQVPDVSLVIAGRNPLQSLQDLVRQHEHISLTGCVDDMRPYFDTSSVYVAPLRSGAGMKNKVLEAWAMKLPVVAASVSCSGIEADHGENILIADTPSGFANEVIRLLKDVDLRKGIAHGGRYTAESVYSWKIQTSRLEDVLQHVLNRFQSAV